MSFLGLKPGLPRFRVRTLLILVAVAALAIEAGRVATLWARYDHRHRVSADAEWRHRQEAAAREAQATALEKAADSAAGPKAQALRDRAARLREEAEGFRSLADWSKGLAQKYAGAGRAPWRSVADDPPHRANATMIGSPGW